MKKTFPEKGEVAVEVTCTNRYGVDDFTYEKVKKLFKLTLFLYIMLNLLVAPLSILVLETPIGYWFIIYTLLHIAYLICFHKKIIIIAKYTQFYGFLSLSFVSVSFIAMTLAFLYVINSGSFFVFISLLIFIAMLVHAFFGYKHYHNLWMMNKNYNEKHVLDMDNAIYSFIENFKQDYKKTKKMSQIKESDLYEYIIPISAAISVFLSYIFGRLSKALFNFDLRYLLLPLGALIVGMGILRLSMGAFNNYFKLLYYEKKIGKEIRNGIL